MRKAMTTMDKKLADSEIIKALECCGGITDGIKECSACSLLEKSPCTTDLSRNALDLINRLQAKVIKEQNKNSKLRNERNRQQAEIERLKGWQDLLKAEKHSLIKAEAYKEFAEMLISKIADVMKHIERNPYDSKDETNGTICGLAHAIGRIKDLLKEKVGENNA